jgi:hypothetical protein
MDLLGTTFDGFRSHGFLDEITEQGGGCPCRLAALFFTGGGGAGLSIASGEDLLRPSTAGLMLYRQAIPEPNSVALILLPFLGAVVARSRSFGHFHVRQLLFTALCCFLPVIADAEVFERDWRVGGDGLLTYDDVNRREWLDVPVSLLSQFPEPHYENAVAELVPGGLFDGFTLAVRADVVALAESAGIDTTTTVVAINGAPTRKLIDLLGPTLGSFRIHAFLADFSPFELPVVSIFDVQSNTAGLRIGGTDDFLRFSNSGLMLYRQAIPEPSALLLTIVLSLSALSYRVGHSLIQNRWRIRLNVK